MGFRVMILAGAVALLLAACGGSSKTTSTSTNPDTSGPLPPIAHRLLTSGELSGFNTNGRPTVATSVQQWLQDTQTPAKRQRAETARLTHLGFVTAATQNLTSAKGPGLSLVEQFRSAKGAHSEFASQVTTFKFSLGIKQFAVPGVPGAFGFGVGGGGVNVVFAEGDYYYVVGAALPATAANRAAVISTAQKLYQRFHT